MDTIKPTMPDAERTSGSLHRDGYAAAVELLEAEADRLRDEFEKAAGQAASPYHLGSDYVQMGFKADEFRAAAAWLRGRHNNASATPIR